VVVGSGGIAFGVCTRKRVWTYGPAVDDLQATMLSNRESDPATRALTFARQSRGITGRHLSQQ
jgi:hypothetical protein